ncbi:hypothetical protein O0I10_011554 [Lichtheimia ornata]|uniref:Uncharacterized protein n=1 Tax=Lichtheimia ornata TaxID=688661 RepID=A0AAD7UUR1_9FUNG|nr:uncharacterized protein O0I10_011554 [Lichtheimia ornata]KAJ8652815.1 hypothetical protein O0I10_011554 [Lichtheimia ornata]
MFLKLFGLRMATRQRWGEMSKANLFKSVERTETEDSSNGFKGVWHKASLALRIDDIGMLPARRIDVRHHKASSKWMMRASRLPRCIYTTRLDDGVYVMDQRTVINNYRRWIYYIDMGYLVINIDGG